MAECTRGPTKVDGAPAAEVKSVPLMIGPPPEWAAGLHDVRHVLPYDTEQVLVPIAFGDYLTHATVDTGAGRTLMSIQMAQALRLKVEYANNTGELGIFQVPGASGVMSYAGRLSGSVRVTLGPDVHFDLAGLRIIHHPYPMLLLGCDVLRGGRPKDEWNFTALKAHTVGPAEVRGWLVFQKGENEQWCACAHCPAEGKLPSVYKPLVGAHVHAPTSLNMVGGPPLGYDPVGGHTFRRHAQ